jgi:hypothetical protein
MRSVGGAAKTANPTPNPASDFETFWHVYPRKVGKLAAMKAYAKALTLATAAELEQGAIRYGWETMNTELQYVAHPKTWLNQGRWMDEPMTTTGATIPHSMMTCPHDPPCVLPGRDACQHKTNLEKFRRGEL